LAQPVVADGAASSLFSAALSVTGRQRLLAAALATETSASFLFDPIRRRLMYGAGRPVDRCTHRFPLLAVMHNNRGYHQEIMHIHAWRTSAIGSLTLVTI
jgi:hypothetical protein